MKTAACQGGLQRLCRRSAGAMQAFALYTLNPSGSVLFWLSGPSESSGTPNRRSLILCLPREQAAGVHTAVSRDTLMAMWALIYKARFRALTEDEVLEVR